ncbi:SH3 domain-containing protein [Chryseobacterium piscium]|nr:SH3 domain-containing protein [Chryseobacterium piscium]
MINIAKGGTWQADAVNYFQNGTLNYIKNNKRYNLINSLTDKDARSVLSFLFDSPNSKNDSDFVSNLNKDKQEIAKKILSKSSSNEKKRSALTTYENNKDYFIKTFDVNKDGISDKIVSSKPYQGEDLFVFYGNESSEYDLSLETINFSEDGGNIIKDIVSIPNSKGLTVITYFPDRGYYEKEYNIIPENSVWILKNIIYKTMSEMSENTVKYICDVTQNIDITKSNWTDKINSIPDENERSKKCRTEQVSDTVKKYYIQDPDGYTNLRKEKNTTSEVLQKINSGENIDVLDNSGDWFLVKTKSGKEGYVHKSHVKSEQ